MHCMTVVCSDKDLFPCFLEHKCEVTGVSHAVKLTDYKMNN